jgi:Zn-dependent protease
VDPDIVPRLLAVAVMLLVGFPIHEFSHAFAAYRLGDSTARYMGRMTLDPRKHFDPLGGGILALGAIFGGIFIGWAKPTPVNPINLEGGRRGEAIVAAAGPLSNLILAAAFAVPVRLITSNPALLFQIQDSTVGNLLFLILFFLVVINVFLFIFNLLPIPPLDGYKVLTGLVSPRLAWQLRQYEQYGFVLLILIFFIETQTRGGGPIGRIGGALLNLLIGR